LAPWYENITSSRKPETLLTLPEGKTINTRFLRSVPFWCRCGVLCTSGFVDDVMFSHDDPVVIEYDRRNSRASNQILLNDKDGSTDREFRTGDKVCYLLRSFNFVTIGLLIC